MNYINTLFFLFIRIVSNPLANALQKKVSYQIDSVYINFCSYLVLSIFCIPMLNRCLNINFYNNNLLLYILIAGILCSLGTFFLIKAVNLGDLSVLGPINSYKSVIGLISAFVLLKEIPTSFEFFGLILIIFGSYFIFDSEKEGFSFNILKRRDIQYRILALILTGVEASILKKIIILTSVEVCFVFWCLSGMVFSFILVLIYEGFYMEYIKNNGKNSIKTNRFFVNIKKKENIINIICISVCLGLMQYSTNYVFKHLEVGLSLALFQLSSIVAVLLGFKMFNEKHIIKKFAGTVIMLLGSVLIIFN